ncbi:MAG: HAD-IA family hydrolase [Pseudomonadota bacterium]
MTIQAVVFDIGNVLLEWQPEAYYDAHIGADRRKALFAEVPLEAMNLEVDRGAPFRKSVEDLAAAHPAWADEIMMWHDCWLDIASPAIDHSARLMKAVQATGMPVFSLTNFGIDTYEIAAEAYPILRDFDRDFISGHMKEIKPDARIYEMLEDGAGLSGEALIFTDDRADNIAAAQARGWRTHLFEGPQGWADRLVAEGILTADQAV